MSDSSKSEVSGYTLPDSILKKYMGTLDSVSSGGFNIPDIGTTITSYPHGTTTMPSNPQKGYMAPPEIDYILNNIDIRDFKSTALVITSKIQAWVERKNLDPDNILYFMQDSSWRLAREAVEYFSGKYNIDKMNPGVLVAAREDMQIFFEKEGYCAFSENSSEFTQGEDYLKFDLESGRHFFAVNVSPLFRKLFHSCEHLIVRHIYRMGGSEPVMVYPEKIKKEGYKFFRESGPGEDPFFIHLEEALLENKV